MLSARLMILYAGTAGVVPSLFVGLRLFFILLLDSFHSSICLSCSSASALASFFFLLAKTVRAAY